MLTNELNEDIGSFLDRQAGEMLSKQLSVAEAVYRPRTGTLNKALASKPYTVNGMTVKVRYPKHIRFLDMKRSSRSGRKKRTYAPIYNKYVYGYLKSAVRRKLHRAIPALLMSEWKTTTAAAFTEMQ